MFQNLLYSSRTLKPSCVRYIILSHFEIVIFFHGGRIITLEAPYNGLPVALRGGLRLFRLAEFVR